MNDETLINDIVQCLEAGLTVTATARYLNRQPAMLHAALRAARPDIRLTDARCLAIREAAAKSRRTGNYRLLNGYHIDHSTFVALVTGQLRPSAPGPILPATPQIMAFTPEKKHQRKENEAQIEGLLEEGLSISQIAERLGVTQYFASRARDRIRKKARQCEATIIPSFHGHDVTPRTVYRMPAE